MVDDTYGFCESIELVYIPLSWHYFHFIPSCYTNPFCYIYLTVFNLNYVTIRAWFEC